MSICQLNLFSLFMLFVLPYSSCCNPSRLSGCYFHVPN